MEGRTQYIFFTAPSNPFVAIYGNNFLKKSIEQATWKATVCHQVFPHWRHLCFYEVLEWHLSFQNVEKLEGKKKNNHLFTPGKLLPFINKSAITVDTSVEIYECRKQFRSFIFYSNHNRWQGTMAGWRCKQNLASLWLSAIAPCFPEATCQ